MTGPQSRRADAARNRERILDAARRVYQTAGRDAPLDRIAAEAGVGNATLYRHFPNREQLRNTVLQNRIGEVEAELAVIETDPDPWRAVERYVRFLAAAPDNAFMDVLLTPPPATPPLRELRDRLRGRVEALLDRAHAAHVLRDGYTVDDMNVFLFSHAKIATSELVAPAAAETLLCDYLSGIRNSHR